MINNITASQTFLQSTEWGELQKKLEYKIFWIKSDHDQILSIFINSKRGRFLFVPHGPIINKDLLNNLLIIAKKNNCAFIRYAPLINKTNDNQLLFSNLGFRRAPIHMHAEDVWVLPIDKPEDQLLTEMRKTTRYLIKKATKDKVIIAKRTDIGAVDDFYKIYLETAKREHFVPFSKDYITHEFNSFNKTGNALFLFGNNTAAALILFTKSTGFYHQGASIHTKIPVTYLLQWEAIREAKKRGCVFYNFWGISPNDNPKHPWHGLTQFKQGFGGHMINFLPTLDLPLSPKYYLTYLYETILRLKRKL